MFSKTLASQHVCLEVEVLTETLDVEELPYIPGVLVVFLADIAVVEAAVEFILSRQFLLLQFLEGGDIVVGEYSLPFQQLYLLRSVASSEFWFGDVEAVEVGGQLLERGGHEAE